MNLATLRREVTAVVSLTAVMATGCGEDSPGSTSGAATTSDAVASIGETNVASVTPSPTTSTTEPAGSTSTGQRTDLSTSTQPPTSSSLTSEASADSSQFADSTTDSPTLHDASTPDGASSTTDLGSSSAESATEGETSVNVCDEVVPEELFVDGIPAYSQCAASESEGIWSSDGISTSIEQPGDWRRTQWGGGYQCTEFASRYLYFVWGVESVPNGNAGNWCDSEPPEGLVQAPTPVHGDLIVFAPGSCGASPETGHVAVIDIVDEATNRVEIVEQNRAGRRRTDFDCAACFLHAVSNSVP
jgi:surface antigen